MDKKNLHPYFELFTEIGILEQLSRNALEANLPEGMIHAHFAVLNHLSRVGDGDTPVQIASAFQTPKTSMTNTLATLERRGLVEMHPNPRDKRSKQVWLTDAGRKLHLNTIEGLAGRFVRMAEDISLEEVVQILPALRNIRAYMDQHRKD
jgi:DNA-binding MarR family transcriptional regulator